MQDVPVIGRSEGGTSLPWRGARIWSNRTNAKSETLDGDRGSLKRARISTAPRQPRCVEALGRGGCGGHARRRGHDLSSPGEASRVSMYRSLAKGRVRCAGCGRYGERGACVDALFAGCESLFEAVVLANAAAGVVVGKVGTATAKPGGRFCALLARCSHRRRSGFEEPIVIRSMTGLWARRLRTREHQPTTSRSAR